MKRDRTVQTLFAGAAILLLLGVGNLLVGQNRLTRYREALSDASAQLAIAEKSTSETGPTPIGDDVSNFELSVDRQTRLIQSIKARIDFYTLVVLGGRCMLAFGGVCLLGIVLHRGMASLEPD